MPKFVDDLHVAGALQASADPAKVTNTLQKAVSQSVDMQQYLDTDGATVKGKVDANFIATFQAVIAAGLTGATSASRYVGATASGAPASGTFITGDWCISKADAKVYVCTSGGSPGTWTSASAASTTLRPGLKSGLYYAAGPADGNSLNLGNGVASVLPFWFPAGTTLTRLGVFLNGAASAGGVFRFIVYADDGAGYPGALISDAGTVPTTTGATGVGLTGLSISVSGWVWIGGVQQGSPATPATVYFTQSSQHQGTVGRDLPNLWNNAVCYTQTGITGAAPGTFGTPSVGTQAYRIGAGI